MVNEFVWFHRNLKHFACTGRISPVEEGKRQCDKARSTAHKLLTKRARVQCNVVSMIGRSGARSRERSAARSRTQSDDILSCFLLPDCSASRDFLVQFAHDNINNDHTDYSDNKYNCKCRSQGIEWEGRVMPSLQRRELPNWNSMHSSIRAYVKDILKEEPPNMRAP